MERKAKRNVVLVLTLTHTLGEDREGIYKRWNFFWFPHWRAAFSTHEDPVCLGGGGEVRIGSR